MSGTEPRPEEPFDIFLRRYWADREAGTVRPLAEYVREHPAAEAEIVHEYAALENEATPEADRSLATAAAVPEERDRIGPYRFLRRIGSGGQGIVHLAEDVRFGREVVIKILRTDLVQNDRAYLRFQREAGILARLDHPGICAVYDAGSHEGHPYIVMRYVRGVVLSEWIAGFGAAEGGGATSRGRPAAPGSGTDSTDPERPARPRSPVAIPALCRLVEKAAEAIHVAHEAGVVHRDLKPGNIMVTPEGDPVILDFGLAFDEEVEATSITTRGGYLGTRHYMAPEQHLLKPVRADRRTDVWGLGVVLYEGLTGRRPFEGATERDLNLAIMSREPSDLRRLNPAVPRDLATVVLTALEKDRDRRYQSALALAEDLRRVRELRPIVARPAGPWLRIRRWYQRNPALSASVTAAFLFLAGGLAATLLALRTAKTALADHARLADLKTCQDLQVRAELLWPATPEIVDGPRGLDAWIRSAEDVLSRAPLHRATLAAVEKRARPYSEAQRAEDERQNRLELREDATVLDRLKRARASGSGESPESAARIAAMEARLDRRRTWDFDDPGDDVLYRSLVALDAALSALPERIESLRRRRDDALRIDRETIEAPAAAWTKAAAELLESSRYERRPPITLPPQRGLIPLGFDPDSGLQEFAVFGTGTTPERDPKTRRLAIDASSAMVLVLLPGGTFVAGSPEIEVGRQLNESPHRVTLLPFFIGKHEVTQRQWARVTGNNPSTYREGSSQRQPADDRHPVENVSWTECAAMARRLGLALPTEAQWEFACRGGAVTAFAWGDDPGCLEDACNIADQCLVKSMRGVVVHRAASWNDGWAIHAPVGSFEANGFGLFDVHGNVSEWCVDRYAADPPADDDTPGDGLNVAAAGSDRVLRGGSWYLSSAFSRCAMRHYISPVHANHTLGVRLARALL